MFGQKKPARPIDKLAKKSYSWWVGSFVLVKKSEAKSWYAIFIIAFAAGAAAAMVWSVSNNYQPLSEASLLGGMDASRKIKAETAKAITPLGQYPGIKIEGNLPGYLPSYMRTLAKIYDNTELLVTADKDFNEYSAELILQGKTSAIKLAARKKNMTALVLAIPQGVPAGKHTLNLTIDGQRYGFIINTLKSADTSLAKLPSGAAAGSAVKFRGIACGNSGREMVLAGIPGDPNKLLISSNNVEICQTTDGGKNWKDSQLNKMTSYPHPYMAAGADPGIVALKDGSFYHTRMYVAAESSEAFYANKGVWGGILYKGQAGGGRLENYLFQDTAENIPVKIGNSSINVFADRPVLAVDRSSSAVYIAANAVWFPEEQTSHSAVYVSADAGKTFNKYGFPGSAVMSLAVGGDKKLYGARQKDAGDGIEVLRFSFNPYGYETITLPGTIPFAAAVKDSKSKESFMYYAGPEIVADEADDSPHRGRLYLVWAQPEKILTESDLRYGLNFDIYSSYSDDNGGSWSSPSRVSDDTDGSDQLFPSAKVGPKGVLHVAFLDHRGLKDWPALNVYYSYSKNGRDFSKNIKVNRDAIPLTGLRPVGDYLGMVMPYDDIVYFAYPCKTLKNVDSANGACLSSLDASKLDGGGCQDLDGADYYKKSTTSYDFKDYTDYCLGANGLVEYSCQREKLGKENYYCAGGCTDGACAGKTCADSDLGKDYNVKGSANICYGKKCGAAAADSCLDANKLKEYYCADNAINSENYQCPASCKSGACVPDTFDKTFSLSNGLIAKSLGLTKDGGFIIGGKSANSTFLLKMDKNGDKMWLNTYYQINSDAYSAQQTKDGGYMLSGDSYSNFYLIKTDSSGIMEWNNTYAMGPPVYGYSAQQTKDGGYVIAGMNVLQSASNDIDFYLIKTAENGKEEWRNKYGGDGDDFGKSVLQTHDGGYVMTGSSDSFSTTTKVLLVKINPDGTEAWKKTYGGDYYNIGNSIQETADGGYIIGGSGYSSSKKLTKLYLVKTDNNGVKQWDKYIGSYLYAYQGLSVMQTSDGGYLLAGSLNRKGYLVKTDKDGNKQWDKTLDSYSAIMSAKEVSPGYYAVSGGYRDVGYADVGDYCDGIYLKIIKQ